MAEEDKLDFRVTLRNSTNTRESVTFATTPDLIEARNANYKTVDPIHAPGQIAAYQNTSSRNFSISSIRLISRTTIEAEANLKTLWILRSWLMPSFGKSTKEEGRELRGSPPPVLYLTAYSKESASNQSPGHINRVPVVLQNLSIPYPSDVDYIPTSKDRIPMPTIMTLDMTLMETHSPNEYENFSISNFRKGILRGF